MAKGFVVVGMAFEAVPVALMEYHIHMALLQRNVEQEPKVVVVVHTVAARFLLQLAL